MKPGSFYMGVLLLLGEKPLELPTLPSFIIGVLPVPAWDLAGLSTC